ncbi:hypothetical protein [Rhodococcus marinonascens]|uniref:hypothetical protein n=1 Tax=Rhodococcus marinonascens TaxID=38311 RepID=UPI0011147281|nr:hypothetical protein [Rhodococcus marinonascens]
MTQIRVTVSRWQTRGPWWRGRRRVSGLVLDIDGHGTTQTYGSRDLDAARVMVLEYLGTVGAPAPTDVTLCWCEAGT